MTFGKELVGLLTKPFMFGKFLVHAGGSVEVWTKNILYRFMKGQTHFGMSEGSWSVLYGADLSAFCLKNKKQKIQGATWMSYSFSGWVLI